MSRHPAGSHKSLTLERFIELHLGDPEQGDGVLAYRRKVGTAWWVLADELPSDLVERPECARSEGHEGVTQIVWVDEASLIVVAYIGQRGIRVGTLAVEFFSAEDGFHDRLDELAGVAAPVPHQAPDSSPKRCPALTGTDLSGVAA